MYEIENDVPIPIGIYNNELVDAIRALEPKQSIWVPDHTGAQLYTIVQTLRKRLKRRFMVRTSPKGARIWRVE